MTIKEKIKPFATVGIGTILNVIVGVITTPVITRLVSTSEYGSLSIFETYTSLAVMVLCLGLDQSLIRFFYDYNDYNYKKNLLRFTSFTSLFITLCADAVFLILVRIKLVKIDFDFTVCALLSLNIAIQVFLRFSQIVLRTEYKMKLFASVNVIQKIAYLFFAIILLYYIPINKFKNLACATVLSFSLALFVSIISNRNIWNFKNVKTYKYGKIKVIKYGIPFIVSMGLTTLFSAQDKLSLNHYSDKSVVGIYSSALIMVNVFTLVQTTFTTVWAPMAVEHYTKKPDDKDFFAKVVNIITIIIFTFGFSVILFKDIFAFFLGSSFREAKFILPFLVLHPIMYTISEVTSVGIEYSKKTYLHVVISAIACLCNFCGNSFLVPIMGGRGAAISTGLSYIVFFLLRSFFGYKYFSFRISMSKVMLLTLATVVFAIYAMFNSFNLIILLLYFCCLSLLLSLYRSDIVSVYHEFIKNKN